MSCFIDTLALIIPVHSYQPINGNTHCTCQAQNTHTRAAMTSRKRRSPAPVPPPLTIPLEDLAHLPDPALTLSWDHFQAVAARARAQIALLQGDLDAATQRYQAARTEICMRRLERTRKAALEHWKAADKAARLKATLDLTMDWLGLQFPQGAVIRHTTLEGLDLLHVALPSREQLIYSLYDNGDVRCKDHSSFNVVHDVPRSW